MEEAGERADAAVRDRARIDRLAARSPMGKPIHEKLHDTQVTLGKRPSPPPPSPMEKLALERAGVPERLHHLDRCLSDFERELHRVPARPRLDGDGQPINPEDLPHAERYDPPEKAKLTDLVNLGGGAVKGMTGLTPPLVDEDSNAFSAGDKLTWAGGPVSGAIKGTRKGLTKAVGELAEDGAKKPLPVAKAPDPAPDASIEQVHEAAKAADKASRSTPTQPGKVVVRVRREQVPAPPPQRGRAERPAPADSATLRRDHERDHGRGKDAEGKRLNDGSRYARRQRFRFDILNDVFDGVNKQVKAVREVLDGIGPPDPPGAGPLG